MPVVRLAAALCAAALSAACADRDPSLPAATDPAPAPPDAALLRCTVVVRAGTLACERMGAPSGVRGVLLGGQGVRVRLASSGTSYDAGTQILRSDVTVENLTGQALGTTNGYLPAPEGVRVFFALGPTVVSGSGSVSVANADGTDVFTAAGQAYFRYDGVLLPGDTSAPREWRFSVSPTVGSFTFGVLVAAPVPREAGSVKMSPIAPSLQVGGTVAMDASVRTVTGRVVAGAPVTWTTSDSAVATVDAAGLVTGTGAGSATITASSGARSGRVSVEVTAGTPPPTIVWLELSPKTVTANGSDTLWAQARVTSPVDVPGVLFAVSVAFGNGAQCNGDLASGTQRDGVYRCALVLPDGANHGVWALNSLSASNGADRQMFLTAMLDAGADPFFGVRSPDEDVTAPTLTGFGFAPDTARAGVDAVAVDIGVGDAGVGAAQATAIFRNELDAPGVVHGCGTSGLSSGTPQAGTFHCEFTVRPDATPGSFKVIYVELIDGNGNIRTLYTAELEAAGWPTVLTVVAADPP